MQLWDRAPIWPWVIVALLIAVVSLILLPVGIIILGAALSVGGLVGYRQNRDPRVKALAAGTLAGGIACFLWLAFVMVFLVFQEPR